MGVAGAGPGSNVSNALDRGSIVTRFISVSLPEAKHVFNNTGSKLSEQMGSFWGRLKIFWRVRFGARSGSIWGRVRKEEREGRDQLVSDIEDQASVDLMDF
jgi:hypothetical protein